MNATAKEKARNLRYKKALLSRFNYYAIRERLEEISEDCDYVRYFIEDDSESLLEALDGNEDEEYEFRMMFCDLSSRCENLTNALYDGDISDNFDDFFVGIVGNRYDVIGYDSYEEDYYALSAYETGAAQSEAGKRLSRLTKSELLSQAGQCFGVALAYIDIEDNYQSLKAAFDILKDENHNFLQAIKDIEEAYEKANEDNFRSWDDSTREFEKLCAALPERVWIE